MIEILLIPGIIAATVLAGFLLSLVDPPDAPPPGAIRAGLPPAPGRATSLDHTENPGNREAAPHHLGRLLTSSGCLRRAP